MDVSYFRKQAEKKFQERQAFLKSNAPPPTVGLIKVFKSACLASVLSVATSALA